MVNENVAGSESEKEREGYDFTGKSPTDVLTQDELEHFDECMQLKNKSRPADEVDFARAAKFVTQDFDRLFS
jgi:hypothetical protein